MPRMKNGRCSGSPKKKLGTLENFGFTHKSPGDKTSKKIAPPASAVSTPSPRGHGARRGRSASSRDASVSSDMSDIEKPEKVRKPKDKQGPGVTLKIKREKLGQYTSQDTSQVSKTNGEPERASICKHDSETPRASHKHSSSSKEQCTGKGQPSVPTVRLKGRLTSPDKPPIKLKLSVTPPSPEKPRVAKPAKVYTASRSARTIKPTKRLLESRDEVTEAPSKRVKVVTEQEISLPREAEAPQVVTTPGTEFVSGKRTRKPSRKVLLSAGLDDSDNEAELTHKKKQMQQAKARTPITEPINAEKKCASCFAVSSKIARYFQDYYCFSCIHTWKKYLILHTVPDCVEGCLGCAPSKCIGCRAIFFYFALPDDKRKCIKLKKTVRERVETMRSRHTRFKDGNTISDSTTPPVMSAPTDISETTKLESRSPATRTPQPVQRQTDPCNITPSKSSISSLLISPMRPGTVAGNTNTSVSDVLLGSGTKKTVLAINQKNAAFTVQTTSQIKNKLQTWHSQKSLVVSSAGLTVSSPSLAIQSSNSSVPWSSVPSAPILNTPTKTITIMKATSPQQSQPPAPVPGMKQIGILTSTGVKIVNVPIVTQASSPIKIQSIPSASSTLHLRMDSPIKNPPGLVLPPSAQETASQDTTREPIGPRIKHVSRSATIVQGQGEAAVVGPASPTMRLSALPPEEKCKIWNEGSEFLDDEERIPRGKDKPKSSYYDDDEWMEDEEEPLYKPKMKSPKMKISTKFVKTPKPLKMKKTPGGTGKRMTRCGDCSGCNAVNCRVCVYCLDMKKYGGPGKMKQCCAERRCIYKQTNPQQLTHKQFADDEDDEMPRRKARPESPQLAMPSKRIGRPPKRYRSPSQSSVTASSQGDADSERPDHDPDDIIVDNKLTNKPLTELLKASSSKDAHTESSNSLPIPPLSIATPLDDGLLLNDQNPGFSLSEETHRIMADFIDTYDIDKVWKQGVAIVASAPQSIRVLCYLCGSSGHHQVVYCAVCCEPFHDFCLEEAERPAPNASEWVCRNCRFCYVCGKLDELLACDLCQKTYHPACLGDGFNADSPPGKWRCTSCMKCKSCGSTTPGAPGDAWNYDHSLCAKCEKLRLKGNFCPICGLCYSDDDWDCKMIGCSSCDSWTHAKCEYLPDDLYELIGYVGDDEAQYVCRTCLPVQPPGKPDWLETLEKLRNKGFNIIIASLMDKKYSAHLNKIDLNELKKFYETHHDELAACKDLSSCSRSSTRVSPERCIKAPAAIEKSEAVGHDKPVEDESNQPQETAHLKKEKQTIKTEDDPSTKKSEETPGRRTSRRAKPELEAPVSTRSLRTREPPAEKPSKDDRDGQPESQPEETPPPRRRSARAVKEEDTTGSEGETPPRRSSRQSLAQSTPKEREPKEKEKTEKPSEMLKMKPIRGSGSASKDESQSEAETSTPRRSARERTKPKSSSEEVASKEKTTEISVMETSQDQSSIMDISSGSLPDVSPRYDPVDLSIRFKDIEWVRPHITYESLTEGGLPVDLYSIKEKCDAYTSVADFVDDVVRVVQGSLVRAKYHGHKVLKQTEAVRKLFEQEVSQLFPWFDVNRSAQWEHNLSVPKLMLPEASLPPSDEHTYAKWLRKDDSSCKELVQPSPYKSAPPPSGQPTAVYCQLNTTEGGPSQLVLVNVAQTAEAPPTDYRRCQLCNKLGDDKPNDAGRLVYAGADDWVHVNCALWSAEVFEEVDGTLQRVHAAVARGKQLDCSGCASRGATIGCCARNCNANFHLMCARQAGCRFMDDKQVFCPSCLEYANGVINEKFIVARTVTVDFAHVKIKKSWQQGFKPSDLSIVAGSMTVESLGRVAPQSDYLDLLVPINYSVSRVYWSTKTPYQRCVYSCRVIEVQTKKAVTEAIMPDVTICHDPSLPDFIAPEFLHRNYPNVFPAALTNLVKSSTQNLDQVNDPFSVSWPGAFRGLSANQSKRPAHSLSASWPSMASPSSLSMLSESTRRMLGHIPPEKLRPAGNYLPESDLADLTGIAATLNKAAYRSTREKRRRDRKKLLKSVKLYGAAQPEGADLNDGVAEIMDIVADDGLSEEELEDREVIILPGVDELVADKMVEELGRLTQAEMERMGGIHKVVDKLMKKYESVLPGGAQNESCSSSSRASTSVAHSPRRMDEKLVTSVSSPSLVPSLDTICEDSQEAVDALPSGRAVRSATAGHLRRPSIPSIVLTAPSEDSSASTPSPEVILPAAPHVETPPTASEQMETDSPPPRPGSSISLASSTSSLQACSSISSAESPPEEDDSDSEITGAAPPKIVITDFSAGSPMETLDIDPFKGVALTSAQKISHGLKDRLKRLVRTRSESFSEISPNEEPVFSGKRRASLGDIFTVSDNPLDFPPTPSQPSSAESVSRLIGQKQLSIDPIDDVPTIPTPRPLMETSKLHQSGTTSVHTNGDSSVVDTAVRVSTETKTPVRKELPTQLNDEPLRVIPCPKSAQRRRKKFKGFSLSSLKWNFNENFYANESEVESSIDRYIITRDRTPEVTSSSDSESESDDDDLQRVIVPPNVNCLVRSSLVNHQLPTVLNAKVVVDRLPDLEIDSESDADMAAPIIQPLSSVISTPPKEVSREVRKDMINYCEDSGSSSSTDEEDLVPRTKLRRRAQINYNENDMQRAQEESDDNCDPAPARRRGRPPKHPQALTGRVLLARDGTVKRQSENIPSDLQKTISDAIRKARNRQYEPRQHSVNQAYSGASSTGGHSMRNTSRGQYSADLVAKRQKVDMWGGQQPVPIRRQDYVGDKCRLTMLSPSARQSSLPNANPNEEIIQSGMQSKRADKSTNHSKVASVVLAFEITSDDGFKCQADNWNDAWRMVTEAVRDTRSSAGCSALSYAGVTGLHMYGLEHSSITYFTEQLYGARFCENYRFKFHKPPLFEYEEELPENETGCCRSEPFTTRKPPEMFSFIDSRYRKRPAVTSGPEEGTYTAISARRATSTDLPMAMRFRHLRTHAKEAAGVYTSSIHGRGLYCKRRIESGEMVIEYAGEVIRVALCDKREKYYERRNIGCYMFRIDDYLCVDATMKGNAARFINHSCDPNCYSKVIDVGGEKHIVIFAMKTIERGEELTYDYKFPFEEVKIPCTCGAKRCRQFLN